MTEIRFDVTTIGETMLRLSVPAGARLENAASFDVHAGGAESNVVALLARLGRRTAWAGSLPTTSLGRLVANQLRAAGVDLSGIHWCSGGRMGTYYVEFATAPRPIQVLYDRADSCAAQQAVDDVAWDLLLATRLLHLTGITPALSATCRQLTEEAIRRAVAAGVAVSLDTNYRAKLWSPEIAAAVLRPLLQQVTLLFCAHGDAQRLFGCAPEPQQAIADLAAQSSAQAVVMSVGEAGVLAWQNGTVQQVDAVPATVFDRLGAGDALAAGVIHGWLEGDLAHGLQMGTLLAALALTEAGDMVTTTQEEVTALLATQQTSGGRVIR